MKLKYYVASLFFFVAQFQIKAIAQENMNLIPKPSRIERKSGHFQIKSPLNIYTSSKFAKQAGFLSEQLRSKVSEDVNSAKIKLMFDKTLPVNAYKLEISPFKVTILASNENGITSGLFSFLQLKLLQTDKALLPCLKIYDAPEFSYRGLHLDASRNFISIQETKKIIDMMAMYKLNTFHWHLTDGPGWRIEIKKYPELTQFAAWRPFQDWKGWWASERHYSKEGSAGAYGGYYTQQQAKDLVSYASNRGITVIPEIEMPGHSEEVLATYPFLACSGKPYTQSELCIGNEQTFSFIQNVLSEIIAIFPGKYIHMGGDEADTKAWHQCEKCQARMKADNLSTEKDLQSYAMKRIEKFLISNKREMIGWDEILEGGLPKNATVMSWRGERGGIEAAKQGHDVIMTPGGFCYFDQYQSDPRLAPEAIGGYLPINKVYSYNPLPVSLSLKDSKHVLGAQANVWTEYINNADQLEYMIFPRLLALAEVVWSSRQNKNWLDFFQRMQSHYLLLQRSNINYYRPSNNTVLSSVADTIKKASYVTITSEKFGPEIRYTTDGTSVNKESKLYTEPFQVNGITDIHSAIIESEKVVGKESVIQAIYHKGVGANVSYISPYSLKYPAQGTGNLVNGQLGGFSYHDKQWQGFEGKQFEVILELKQLIKVDSVAIHFMQLTGPGIFMPSKIEYSWSESGTDFSKTVEINNTIPVNDPRLISKFFVGVINSRVKYLKIKALNNMKGFLFADEIIIY